MAWIGALASVAGGLLSSDGEGGGMAAESGPWAAAQPWLAKLAMQGSALQDQYTAMPFSQEQLAAINNQFGLGDYMRKLVPGLLGQMQGQPLGFDRSNPTARPKAFDWGAGGENPFGAQGLLDAQARQRAIDDQDRRESEDLIAGRRDATRFFPLGLTYGQLTPQGIKGK